MAERGEDEERKDTGHKAGIIRSLRRFTIKEVNAPSRHDDGEEEKYAEQILRYARRGGNY